MVRLPCLDRCARCSPTCARRADIPKLRWPGPIDALEAEVAGLDEEVKEAEASLCGHVASAEALLAEAVTV